MLKADKGLFKHWMFWLCVFGPILLSVILAWWFGLFSLPFSPTLQGVEIFYDRGRFFLALAALSIPLGATFARMHASEQTAELINVSNDRRKEDNLNDLLGNYLEYLKSYDGKFYGFRGDFEFKENMVGQPIKVFHYLISYKRDDYRYVAESESINEAVEIMRANFSKLSSWEVIRKKQAVTVELYNWIKSEVECLGFDLNLGVKTGEKNKLLGLFFHDDLLFDENQNPSLSKHLEVVSNMSRCLKFISACYYYSSQVFFLYDYDYAKSLEKMSYKTSFLCNAYSELGQIARVLKSELEAKGSNNKIIFNRQEPIDDEHEIYEIFGDLNGVDEDVRWIVTTWYRLRLG